MGRTLVLVNVVCLLVVVVVGAIADGDEVITPPGIANNPSHARCLDKNFKQCHNLEHVCPKFCPNSCTVDCVSCKPVCGDGPTSPPPEKPEVPSPPEEPQTPSPPPPSPTPPSPSPSPPPPSPTPTPTSPSPPPPTPTPTSPSPPPPSPTPPSPSPPPPTPTTSPPSPSPLPSPTPSNPPPSPSPKPPTLVPSAPPPESPAPAASGYPKSPPPPPPPSAPSSTLPTPPPPPTTTTPPPPPPGDSSEAAAGRRMRCKNRNYPHCFGLQHVCPTSCPNTCEVDCVTCKPVCKCDMPGAVCQDPRFIGGDGITFYFHGKKDRNFCLVTEPNFQINAHFIGKTNANIKRDFTWIQSIAILFGDHQLFIGAHKTAAWNNAVDRLSLTFDNYPILLSAAEGSTWKSPNSAASIIRDRDTNSVIIEVEGLFRISAKAVPITQHESQVHNYGITEDDCFAHLELAFKFFSLSGRVNGVLGQTYGEKYVSRAKMGVAMPVLGGEREFAVSNIFATDCAVSQFRAGEFSPENGRFSGLQLPSIKCGSGNDGKGGVVCKK